LVGLVVLVKSKFIIIWIWIWPIIAVKLGWFSGAGEKWVHNNLDLDLDLADNSRKT
jgi:hypothetical protein